MSKISLISPLNQDSIINKTVTNTKNKKHFKKNKKLSILFCGFSCCNSELEELFSSQYDLKSLNVKLTENPKNANVMIFSGLYKTAKQRNFLKRNVQIVRLWMVTCALGGFLNI